MGPERSSGSTFSCVWDTSGTPEGDHQLIATAQDAAGNTASSAPISFAVGSDLAPVHHRCRASTSPVTRARAVTLSVSANDPPGARSPIAGRRCPRPLRRAPSPTEHGDADVEGAPGHANTAVTLRVMVIDRKGGSSQRTVDLQVVDVACEPPPTVAATITAPRDGAGGRHRGALSRRERRGWRHAHVHVAADEPRGPGHLHQHEHRLHELALCGHLRGHRLHASGHRVRWDGLRDALRLGEGHVPTYAADIQPIWTSKCTSCHDNTSPSGGDKPAGRSLLTQPHRRERQQQVRGATRPPARPRPTSPPARS